MQIAYRADTPMPRNLVICCDGTNNEFGPVKTNVARLAKVLVRDEEQLVFYDPGVGTLPEPTIASKTRASIRKTLSLAFGFGLTVNVQEAYTFLMNHWEPGDRVYLFGFSRGAYTVRVLAGLLRLLGLLPKGNEQLVPYAMRLFGAIREQGSNEGAKDTSKYWRLVNEFRGTFARSIPGQSSRMARVHFCGVWDTVSSVGWVWAWTPGSHNSNRSWRWSKSATRSWRTGRRTCPRCLSIKSRNILMICRRLSSTRSEGQGSCGP